jgi:hypothetical protein
VLTKFKVFWRACGTCLRLLFRTLPIVLICVYTSRNHKILGINSISVSLWTEYGDIPIPFVRKAEQGMEIAAGQCRNFFISCPHGDGNRTNIWKVMIFMYKSIMMGRVQKYVLNVRALFYVYSFRFHFLRRAHCEPHSTSWSRTFRLKCKKYVVLPFSLIGREPMAVFLSK